VRLLPAVLALAGLALPVAAWRAGEGLVFAGGGAAVAVACAGLALRAREMPARSLALTASGAVALVLGTTLALVPWVDRQKRLGPFFAEVGARVPPDRAVFAFAPDESTLGMIGFYGRRPAEALWHPDMVRGQLRGAGETWVVIVEKRDEEPYTNGVLYLQPETMLEEKHPGARTLRLLRFAETTERARRVRAP
jgi:hypothetical protein